jgi:hypothetical protein
MEHTRKQATMLGHSKYHTGRVCIRGHISERYTVTGGCVACVRETTRNRAGRERERLRKRHEELNIGLKTLSVTVPENAVNSLIEWANSCLVAFGRHPSNVKD